MRHAEVVTSTAVAAKLSDLMLNKSNPQTDGVILQLLTGAVSVGNRSNQPFPLAAATPFNLSRQFNIEGIYLIGAGTVAIGLF